MKYANKIDKEFVENFVRDETKLTYETIKVVKSEGKFVANCRTKSGLIVNMTFEDYKIKEFWCPDWVNNAWQTAMKQKFGKEYEQDLLNSSVNQEKSFFD